MASDSIPNALIHIKTPLKTARSVTPRSPFRTVPCRISVMFMAIRECPLSG